MNNLSEVAFERTKTARRVNSLLAVIGCLLLLPLFISIDMKDILGNFYLPTMIFFATISLPLGLIISSRFNDACTARCPKCNEKIEEISLICFPMPEACKKCGLPVLAQ